MDARVAGGAVWFGPGHGTGLTDPVRARSGQCPFQTAGRRRQRRATSLRVVFVSWAEVFAG